MLLGFYSAAIAYEVKSPNQYGAIFENEGEQHYSEFLLIRLIEFHTRYRWDKRSPANNELYAIAQAEVGGADLPASMFRELHTFGPPFGRRAQFERIPHRQIRCGPGGELDESRHIYPKHYLLEPFFK